MWKIQNLTCHTSILSDKQSRNKDTMASENAQEIDSAAASASASALIPWADIDTAQVRMDNWVNSHESKHALKLPRKGQSSTPVHVDVVRVNQLDAGQLDDELGGLLTQQLTKVFKYIRFQSSPIPIVGDVADGGADGGAAGGAAAAAAAGPPVTVSVSERLAAYKPEINALFKLIVHGFTTCQNRPTPGSQLMNLVYRNEAHPKLIHGHAAVPKDVTQFALTWQQKWLYILVGIGGRWGWTRMGDYMRSRNWDMEDNDTWKRRLYQLYQRAETLYRICSVMNFVAFLYNGKYRSVLERLLSMRLVYIRSRVARQVNFEYMTQQLVWEGFSEFLFFLLPLINYRRIKQWFRRLFSLQSVTDSNMPDEVCAICSEDPITIPYKTNCGHVFCYYCIRGSRMANHYFRCPRCETVVTSDERCG
jgi:peroxin-2